MLSLPSWHLVLRVKSASIILDLEARWDLMPYRLILLRRRKRSQKALKGLEVSILNERHCGPADNPSAVNRLAESALSQTLSPTHTPEGMAKPRVEAAADYARKLGSKAVGRPKTRTTKNNEPNLLQGGSHRSTHNGGTGNKRNRNF